MYKLIKTKITGFEDRPDSDIGVNANYRTTMGWDAVSQSINVKVEKIIRPDLTRDDTVELSYNLVDERSFTIEDFPMNKENKAWIVDFDVKTEKIQNPFDVYAYTSTIATGSTFHKVMWRNILQRYNPEYLPCFAIDRFYKADPTFNTAVLQFYVADTPDDASDTVITNPESEVELKTQSLKIAFVNRALAAGVLYEILDEQDNIVSSNMVPSSKQQEALYGVNEVSGDPFQRNPSNLRGNRFKVSLPNSDSYKIRVVFINTFGIDKTLPVSFEVNCVNAISNKTRVTSGLKPGETIESFESVRPGAQPTSYYGSEIIKVTTDLNSGDFFKVKLSCGDFYSYSELWVEIE